MPTLTLIRGAQGSGKSTLAKALLEKDSLAREKRRKFGLGTPRAVRHFEADQFWELLGHGKYAFDASKLGMAHEWCQNGVRSVMEEYAGYSDRPDIIVSNTFTTKKELQPYLDLAAEHGYTVQEIICRGQFQNTHGVPEEVVEKKRAGLEL